MTPEQRARLLATFGISSPVLERWSPRQAQAAKPGEILIYGAIVPHSDIEIYRQWFGDDSVISNQIFREKLSEIEGDVTIRVNSPGGDVWEASGMLQAIQERQGEGGTVNATVDGLAASAASVVILPSDEIIMASLATMMIHASWTWAVGSAADLQKGADLLNKLDGQVAKEYAKRMNSTAKEVMDLMLEETWFTAEEAVEAGLADKVYESEPEAGANLSFQRSRQGRLAALVSMEA